MPRFSSFSCVVLGAAVLLGQACGRPRLPDVLLVSLDTLRADHLGCYGYGRSTSPFLDEIAERGIRFERAWAAASNTAPSHMSLFTGLDSFAHGIRPVGPSEPVPRLSADCPTLPEVLQRAGYQTVGLADHGWILTPMGFDRGFDSFVNERTSLPQKVTQLSGALKEADPARPLFVFLHTYAIHAPYLPPPQYHGRFTDASYRGPFRDRYEALVDRRVDEAWDARGNFLAEFEGMGERDLDFLRGLYDEGIAYADDMLRRVWSLWTQHRNAEQTLLVVLSDHGEGFLEHGQLGHRYGLYAELLHVPLLLQGPGLEPRVVEGDFSLTDLFPTVLDYLDLERPPSIQGSSGLALLRGAPSATTPPAFGQLNSKQKHDAITQGDWRLLRWRGPTSQRVRLFDRSTDKTEKQDLSQERADVVRDLLPSLDERAARGFAHNERYPEVPTERLTREDVGNLGALGYLDADADDDSAKPMRPRKLR